MAQNVAKLAPRSYRTKMLLVEEDVYGTYASGWNPVRVPFVAESFRELVQAKGVQHSIESGSQPARIGNIGLRNPTGDITTELITNGWGPLLLKHATSSLVTTVVGPGVTKNHTGQTGASDFMPVGLSVDKVLFYPDGTIFNQRFTGCRVSSLTVSIAKGRATELRAAFVARERVELTTEPPNQRYAPQDLVITGNDWLIWLDRDGDLTPDLLGNVVRCQFTIETGLGKGGYTIENAGLRDRLPQGQRRVSGRMQAIFTSEDEDVITAWLANSAREMKLRATMSTDVDQHVEFNFPAVHIRGTPVPQVTGRGLVRLDFSFLAVVGSGGYDFRWEIQNLESAVNTGVVTRT